MSGVGAVVLLNSHICYLKGGAKLGCWFWGYRPVVSTSEAPPFKIAQRASDEMQLGTILFDVAGRRWRECRALAWALLMDPAKHYAESIHALDRQQPQFSLIACRQRHAESNARHLMRDGLLKSLLTMVVVPCSGPSYLVGACVR